MSACLPRTYADAMADLLSGKSAGDVASRIDVAPRTVKGWQAGESGPHGAHLIRLMSEYDEVFDAIIEMTGRMSSASLSPAQREAVRRALAILSED